MYLAQANPGQIELAWPMHSGAVADPVALQRLFARVLRPLSTGFMSRLRVIVTVPSGTSPNERRVVREAARRAGATSVELIEHVIAAALGTDLPIYEPLGTFIMSAGAGMTEAALLSLGSVVASSSVRVGGLSVDIAIKNALRRNYGMIITDITAEEIKLAMGTTPTGSDTLIEARGQMAADGSTVTAILERSEVSDVLDDFMAASLQAVRECMIKASPELIQDLITRGIYVVGGGALLGGLAERLSAEFDVPVHIVDNARHVIAMGAAKCLEDQESLRELYIPH
jgi:rod shape-determining protein MreB and related proteins